MSSLYVVATPIGNLEDITIRAIKILLSVSLIACEDTRHTGQFIKILKEKYPQYVSSSDVNFISIRDYNEAQIIPKILGALSVTDIALVSDAGTPLISDPGYKLVNAARAAGHKVIPIPGPSAITAALSAAGLPTNKFLFLGFLPKKWELLPQTTTVIYENPSRVRKTIEDIYARYSAAQVVVARELTKIHEEFLEGHATVNNKGEVTILVYLPEQIAPRHDHGD